MEEPFEIVLAHLDGYVRVKLRGDLDYPATVRYGEALQAVVDLRTRVVLDLADLHYLDTAGLQFLIQIANAHDGPVRLEHVRSSIARVLVLTGVGDMFDIDPKEP